LILVTIKTTPQQPHLRFMLSHPAHAMALGLGSGLSPIAPGTAGTLLAWASFALLQPWLTTDLQWACLMLITGLTGVWACTLSAQHLGRCDPSSVVWDEIWCFWGVLWLLNPSSFSLQCAAFALFRFFDALKPGPVKWADALFKTGQTDQISWKQGLGIVLDDVVAAFCTLFVLALWQRFYL
jgi:phosphatidylglycerophosphatase A